MIVPLTRKILQTNGSSVIVFRNARGYAQGCAGYLAREMGLPAANDAIAALPGAGLSSASPDLRTALSGGTAFHTSDLNREERVAVERAYRRGEIRVIAATSGIAAGINTPASAVIIAETNLACGPGKPPMSSGDVRNMAGRAGRYGYQGNRKSVHHCGHVLAANSPRERVRSCRRTSVTINVRAGSRRHVAHQTSPADSASSASRGAESPLELLRRLRCLACRSAVHCENPGDDYTTIGSHAARRTDRRRREWNRTNGSWKGMRASSHFPGVVPRHLDFGSASQSSAHSGAVDGSCTNRT